MGDAETWGAGGKGGCNELSVRGSMHAHGNMDAYTHTPAYTDSHPNKVILWSAQVNKVQERECGRSRGKWLSVYWLIISRGRRDERGEGAQINTRQRDGEDGARQEDGV